MRKWSWKLGEYRGIAVNVHATFLLIVGWVAFNSWLQEGTITAIFEGAAFVLAVFLCVVLHEFGHALMAARYGIGTKDITLLPIGGVARLERMPEDPRQELWVALAGPAVNVAIAAILFVGLGLGAALPNSMNILSATDGFLSQIMLINVILVVFNMLPAFPMDGGRVLRALLALRMEYVRATSIAANVGKAMAFAFGLYGLFSNPFLVLIAAFVWFGANQEAEMVKIRAAFRDTPVRFAMQTDFESLRPEDNLLRAVELSLSHGQEDFPVISDGQLVGLLTRKQLMQGLKHSDPQVSVSQVMDRDFAVVDADDLLRNVFINIQNSVGNTLPVFRNGVLIGLISLEKMMDFVRMDSAMRRTVLSS